MNPNDNPSPASQAAPQGVKPYRLIKLGVDVHWREHVVVRQIDGSSPQSAQRFSPEAFVAWAKPKGSGVNSGLFSSVQLKSTSGGFQRGWHSVGDLASVSAGDEGRLMVSRVILVQVDCNQDRDGSTVSVRPGTYYSRDRRAGKMRDGNNHI